MVVFEVVELVLPPLPLLEDCESRTAVFGTSSITSSAAALVAKRSAKVTARAPRRRLPTLRDTVFSSVAGWVQRQELNGLRTHSQNLLRSCTRSSGFLSGLT